MSEVVFVRNDDNPLARTQTYKYLMYILAALVVLKIILCILNARNPVTGDLNFHAPGAIERIGLRGSLCHKNLVKLDRKTPEIRTHPEWDILRLRVDSLRPEVAEDGTRTARVRVRLILVSETKGILRLLYAICPIWMIRWQRDYELPSGQSTGPYSDQSTATIEYKN